MPPFLFGSLGEYQSALIEESLVGPGVYSLQYTVHWNMGVLQTWSWQICMQWCPNPLAGSFIFSCQHALLPSCIQSFSSPAHRLLEFSANCLPSEATSTSSGRIFDQGPSPEYLQTLCHTYHCHANVVGHYKYSFSCKHCTSPLISLFYIIMIYTSGTICSPLSF